MGFFCRHCGNTFERIEHMEMRSENCWKEDNRATKECGCTLCFCYRTKKHIDLCDMEVIIEDVKMGNPVSECLERLCRDDAKLNQKNMIEAELKLSEYCEEEAWRPHYVAKSLLIACGLYSLWPTDADGDFIKVISISQASVALDISDADLKDLVNGFKDIDHAMAYKLAKVIEGTDVRFWMDLQERYDEYMRKNK